MQNVISKWIRILLSVRRTSVLCWFQSTPTKSWRSTPRTTWSDTAESTSTKSRHTCESTLHVVLYSVKAAEENRELSLCLVPLLFAQRVTILLNTLEFQRLPRQIAQRCTVKYPPGAVTLLRHALAVWPSSVVSPTVGQTWLREADSQCETFPRQWSAASFSLRPSRPQ